MGARTSRPIDFRPCDPNRKALRCAIRAIPLAESRKCSYAVRRTFPELPIGGSRSHFPQRHLATDLGALVTLRQDLQVAPDRTGAILHHPQPHTARVCLAYFETDAVVMNAQHQMVGAPLETDFNLAGLTVTNGIMDGLLHNPVERKG